MIVQVLEHSLLNIYSNIYSNFYFNRYFNIYFNTLFQHQFHVKWNFNAEYTDCWKTRKLPRNVDNLHRNLMKSAEENICNVR